MIRRLVRRLTRLCLFFGVIGLIVLGAASLTTHYLFQEPAHVTWSRYLTPEFDWQRQKYPSLRWAFDILEIGLVKTDPRDKFEIAATGPASLSGPSGWKNTLVGPQQGGGTAPYENATEILFVDTVSAFKSAIKSAQPGTVIQFQPGVYDFSRQSLQLTRAGQAGRPIVVRASELGSVRLRFSLLEGFHVLAPFWTFENLMIEGTCRTDSSCEHAFHVVGDSEGVVIRNNWVTNFNAPLKVNARRGQFPDNGLVANNFFGNERPRKTANPVTLLDIVAASGWQVRKNVIADFAKAGGDHISYGVFFKGAGKNNLFEQNLVRCEWRHHGGTRIGFSFGGGGTSKSACRDGKCGVEHRDGIARNNIIMNCPNDVGIYLNKSARTLIHNNLLVNTRGIDVRFPETDAVIVNNIIDGRIFARDSGAFTETSNRLSSTSAVLLRNVSEAIFANPKDGDFRLRGVDVDLDIGTTVTVGSSDFCDQRYSTVASHIGPIQYGRKLNCAPVVP